MPLDERHGTFTVRPGQGLARPGGYGEEPYRDPTVPTDGPYRDPTVVFSKGRRQEPAHRRRTDVRGGRTGHRSGAGWALAGTAGQDVDARTRSPMGVRRIEPVEVP
ncbi:hypothetical protein [Streptomyces sp. NPDC059129]|uniref:hypothetical protein n=1 Tax=unclassified Streptomyces TaxID=2593676 RepID=UPI0036BDA6CC